MTSIIATKKNKAELVNQLQKPFRNESLGQVDGLDTDEIAALSEGLERCKTLADFALPRGLKLLVDAEYTYMNDGISVVALAMMKHYNKTEAKIGNTYQCYLKQALETITEELEIVTQNDGAAHCSKSSFFVHKFNLWFPEKIVNFFGGEKLVNMLWFWTF